MQVQTISRKKIVTLFFVGLVLVAGVIYMIIPFTVKIGNCGELPPGMTSFCDEMQTTRLEQLIDKINSLF